MKNLVIVESPAKAKTIKKYLGQDFEVLASYGHVRDLIPKSGAVEPDNHFAMHYEVIDRNKKHLDAIAKALKSAQSLYLATDPDREGEAISWHVYEWLNAKKQLKDKTVHRIVFHEITQTAIKNAVAHPRDLSINMVNAQQARRALDYLVGFNLSPLLWKKVRTGLSAGRVQSPALRLIAEREQEIEQFVSQEYWTIEADVAKHNLPFNAKLTHWHQDKLAQFSITNAEQATKIQQHIERSADGQLHIINVEKKQRKRNPAPPFITSTLQQEAARKLGFSTRKTMQIAQQLYEGIELGQDGPIGLITYMRTDSVNLSQSAIDEIRDYIIKQYGEDAAPAQPRHFKTKSKNAQEAHEAVRPTSILRNPDSLKLALSTDQHKLYQLIWKRSLACQMIHATIDTVAVDMRAGDDAIFRANGAVVTNPGFMQVYLEGKDDKKDKDDDEHILPPMEVGEIITLKAVLSVQHFTEPPPRYSEASLVKILEEYGIGRPSTYATIISTIQQRDYVKLEKKRFHPTDIGRVVNKFLTTYFTQYVDYDFTAQLEDELDEVANGQKEWIPVLDEFWHAFHARIEEVDTSVKRSDVTSETIDETCPKCHAPLCIRLGKLGRFIGCTAYPECKFTRPLATDTEQAKMQEPEVITDRKCPACSNDLIVKVGRYGKFIGCSHYPNCKHMEPLHKPVDTGVTCPSCLKGSMMERKSKRDKIFYSCSRYPDCKYAVWNKPLPKPCNKCGWQIMTEKVTKRAGTQHICPECKNTKPIDTTK